MATDLNQYVPTKPGLEQQGNVTHRLRVAPEETEFAHAAANVLAAMEGKVTLLAHGGVLSYNTARVTEVKDNSSTIAYAAGGLRLQTQATPTDNDDVSYESVETITLAQDKVYSLNVRVQVSSAANLGLAVGFVTAGSQPLNANSTDGVWLHKAKNAATAVLRVVENGNAAVDSSTVATLADATDVRIGIRFKAGSSAANSWGYVTINGTRTAMSSAQLTALRTMLATTAPTLSAYLGVRVNGTTQRNALVAYHLAQVDR